MSHIPQRKENDCLNCGALVRGRYCHVCGQENVVPKESFWHMVAHFFYDITHFDSNFFHTVHHLILRPGFLSKEYTSGRRAAYLHPIRMYVFTSAIFFLLFFSVFAPEPKINMTPDPASSGIKKDSSNFEFQFTSKSYRSLAEYDSMQRLLPSKDRDGWLKRRLTKKQIAINEEYKGKREEAVKRVMEGLLHRLPYMLFISLPLFALILKLVYIRRKQFYYSDHGVFTIHLYVFTFLLLLLVFALNELQQLTGWGFTTFIIVALFFLLFFYLYKAMRNFYGQRRAKTFFKFLLVSFLSLIMMLILLVFFLFFSAVTV